MKLSLVYEKVPQVASRTTKGSNRGNIYIDKRRRGRTLVEFVIEYNNNTFMIHMSNEDYGIRNEGVI